MTTTAPAAAEEPASAHPARPDGTGTGEAAGRRAQPARLRIRWLVLAGVAAVAAAAVGISVGPASLGPGAIAGELLGLDGGLDARQIAILREIRLPRVVLGLVVGATLALCGAAYQGVFRNPLADPFLLGAASGAGLGVTIAIAGRAVGGTAPASVPLFAFVGALAAVALTYVLGAAGGRRAAPTSLILAGVAVTSFLTAAQNYVQLRHQETIREVYSWIFGRLSTAGWGEVVLVLPYATVAAAVILVHRRALDVLALGDDEAASLGLRPGRTRLVVVAAASLGTAAAVSASGLIGFVGIIVPHVVRLMAGAGHRVVLPLSLLFGGAFLCLADVAARSVISPAEVPIGVITAFVGAPFFAVVLRSTGRGR